MYIYIYTYTHTHKICNLHYRYVPNRSRTCRNQRICTDSSQKSKYNQLLNTEKDILSNKGKK